MTAKSQSVLLADAGPFCRFAAVGIDALWAFVEYFGPSLRLTPDVAREIAHNAKMDEFAALNQLKWRGWNPDDHVETITSRTILTQIDDIAEGQRRRSTRAGKPRRRPWDEKGEIATVLLAKANGWAVLIDDGDGKKFAQRKGLALFDTEQVCVEMAAARTLSQDVAFAVFTSVYGTERAVFDRRLRSVSL